MVIDNFPLWHAILRHPVGNITLPEGALCIATYYLHFFGHWHFLLFRRPVVSLAVGHGARRMPA